MPEGTRVHDCVEKLKGKRGVNAYAVCQASTGQNFHTGKPLKGDKAMPMDDTDNMNAPGGAPMTKPDDGGPMPGGDGPMGGGGNMPKEPMGSQVIRRCHEDLHHLMNEYDSFMEHIEEPQVKELMEKWLENMEAQMTAFEEFFTSHEKYGGYPPLENAYQSEDEADMGAQPPDVAASGGGLPEPTPEEAAEGTAGGLKKSLPGSNGKGLTTEMAKALTFYRNAKGLCTECGKSPCVCKKGKSTVPGDEEHQAKPGRDFTDATIPLTPGNEEIDDDPGPGREYTRDTLPGNPGDEEHQEKPGVGKGGLRKHHVLHVADASKWMGDYARKDAHDTSDNLNAHYHGTLLKKFADELGGITGGKATMNAQGPTLQAGSVQSSATPQEMGDMAKLVGSAAAASLGAAGKKGAEFPEVCERVDRVNVNVGGTQGTTKLPMGKEAAEVRVSRGGSTPASGRPMKEEDAAVNLTVGKRGKKDGEFPEIEAIDDATDVPHPHALTLKNASSFLLKIAKTHALDVTNDLRADAAIQSAALNSMLHEVADAGADGGSAGQGGHEQGDEEAPDKVKEELSEGGDEAADQEKEDGVKKPKKDDDSDAGGTGEKSLGNLASQLDEENRAQHEQMMELNKALLSIHGALKDRLRPAGVN